MTGDADGKCTNGKLITSALIISAYGLTNDGNSFQTYVNLCQAEKNRKLLELIITFKSWCSILLAWRMQYPLLYLDLGFCREKEKEEKELEIPYSCSFST